jgi:hypothetical protein
MTTTAPTNPYPDITPPAGAARVDDWQPDEPQPYRVVIGPDRTVTDHKLRVSTNVVQLADGSIDDGAIEAPHVYVLGEDCGPLNSDQARELASVLMEAAAEVDGWAAR